MEGGEYWGWCDIYMYMYMCMYMYTYMHIFKYRAHHKPSAFFFFFGFPSSDPCPLGLFLPVNNKMKIDAHMHNVARTCIYTQYARELELPMYMYA